MEHNFMTNSQSSQEHSHNMPTAAINCQASSIPLFQTTHETQAHTQRAIHQTKTTIPLDMDVQSNQTYPSLCRLYLSG
jgi:hypothetical protein